MRGVDDQLRVGERIAFYRQRRSLTQAALAGLVGRSEDWLSKIERGERDLRRLDVLRDVARALRVGLDDLLGQPVLVEDDLPAHDDVPAIRDALMNHRRLSRTLFGSSERAIDAGHVARYTEQVWTEYQAGRVGAVIAALPKLLGSAQALEETADGGEPWAVSARIHHLAATTLAKIGEGDLAWIAAERAMKAGERSGDPLSLASASRAGTHALLASGRFDDAVDLGETAAIWLRKQVKDDDPVALSILGMLHLRTAIAAAHRQDRGTTTDLLRQATDEAARLGADANHWQTSFGPTNVELHRIATSLNLQDVSWVVAHGADVDSSGLPTERSVAHKVDLARANSMMARDDDALSYLLDAEQAAPQLVRHSATVRETVKSMFRRGRATAGHGSPLVGLAERCRAI